MIVTPSYDGKVSIPYLEAVSSYRDKIDFDMTFVTGSSLLVQARNELLARFYEAEEFTHMLMLDADTMLTWDSLVKMLALGVDVVGAPIPLGKKITPYGMVQNAVGPVEKVGHRLYKVYSIGTAALMVSRKAVEDCVLDARLDGRVYLDREGERFEVFRTEVFAGKYWGEDYSFCRKLRELGYTVHAFSDTAVAHADSAKNYNYRAPMDIGESTLDDTWEKLSILDVAFRWTTQDALTKF